MLQSIKCRGPRLYTVNITGRELHELMEILEKGAVQQESYDEVRIAVYLAERIRPQMREQGFYSREEDRENRVFLPIQTSEGMNVGKP